MILRTLKTIFWGFLFISLINLEMVFAAPIIFNTALPVAKGERIFRVQAKYLRSTDDPSTLDRELTVRALPMVGVFGITESLALFGTIPILDKEIEVNSPSGRVSRGDTGIGDSTVMARYTVWKNDLPGQTMRVAPFAALKMPTGEDDKTDSLGRLPQPLQLGSGSWDPSVGLVMTHQTLSRQIDASFSYTFTTQANNFEFGDVGRFDLSYQHRVWPATLSGGVPAFLYGVLESNLIWQDKNEINGVEDNNSGGTIWFLAPGIQYVTKRTVVEAAVQIPVVQDLNGNSLENDFITTLSFRINF